MMVRDGNDIMRIQYSNGLTLEGSLLSRTEHSIRVLTPRSEDALEFTFVNRVWISEDWEPVQVDFAFMPPTDASQATEESCICSHELAANLIHLLFARKNEPEAVQVNEAMMQPVCCHVV